MRRRIDYESFKANPGIANQLAEFEGAVDVVKDDKVVGTVCVPRVECFCEDCRCRSKDRLARLQTLAKTIFKTWNENYQKCLGLVPTDLMTQLAEELGLEPPTLK